MSTFGPKVNDSLLKILSISQDLSRSGPFELELRITSPISTSQFFRVLNSLPTDNITEIESVVTNFGQVRKVEVNGKVRWERKIKEQPFDFKNLGFRIGIAQEVETQPVSERQTHVRRKKTYQYIDGIFRYDLSEVDDSYEIEIEFIGKKLSMQDLNSLVTRGAHIQMILDETELFMTFDEKKLVAEKFNQIMGHKGTDLRKTFNKPVDLHFKDLTSDVILKNRYSITAKADGIRKLILGLNSGVYFITFHGINKISNIPTKDYLIDGELIENTFYVFDVLMFDKTILENRDLITRLSYRKELINLTKSNGTVIKYVSKNFVFFNTAEEFFKGVETIMNETRFVIDGLVFTPVDSGYYGKIFKWKPAEKLTIDFQIIEKSPGIGIKNSKNEIIPFKVSRETVDLGDYQVGDIVEFVFDGKWRPIRPRPDKIEPNFEKVAYDILSILENPITLDTLQGKDLVLMRKYHNRVKSIVYDFLKHEKVRKIVDLGAGRGGDVYKWKTGGFKVIAVEPNKDNLAELKKRVTDSGINVDIIHSTAEDFSCKEKVDAVSMFHSLTFFYDTIQHVDLLIGNIDSCLGPNGFVVIMAVDGKELMKNFPGGNNGPLIKIKYGKKFVAPLLGEVNVNLESTIVNNQYEFLTNFDDLRNRFETMNYNIVQNFLLDGESFLTNEGLLYSHSTHVIVAKKSPTINVSYPVSPSPKRLVSLERPTRIIKDKLPRLSPDKGEFIVLNGEEWILIGTIADTSNLLHAILGAFSSTYVDMDIEQRKIFVLSLRRELGGELADERLSLGFEWVEYFEGLFGLDIFVSSLQDKQWLNKSRDRESIYIYWNDIDDFQTLGQSEESSTGKMEVITLF